MPTYPHSICNRNGFTFLETMIAMGILVVIAAALLTAQYRAANQSRMAEHIAAAQFIARRIATETHLGHSPEILVAEQRSSWSLTQEPAVTHDGSNTVFWYGWTVSHTANPAKKLRFHLCARPPEAL